MSPIVPLQFAPPRGPAPACTTAEGDLWFSDRPADVETAKALCQQCRLRAGCLAGALQRREAAGVWGGQLFVEGVVVARKRGPGRPRKERPLAAVPCAGAPPAG
ncbi:WhiB family transcriptional regulator [Kineococcus glutinatus]|uniref:Transcriptional regulator WhiB n=1 Tax=Kineococcus glutinatus TaxID=1070872 RepID=A0ABP9H6F4_9ACTN